MTSFKRKLFDKLKRRNPIAQRLKEPEYQQKVVQVKDRKKLTPRDIEKLIREEKEEL